MSHHEHAHKGGLPIFTRRFDNDGYYRHETTSINAIFVDAKDPLHQSILKGMQDALRSRGSIVSYADQRQFPDAVNVAFRFDNDPYAERKTGELAFRHTKPRGHKKANYIVLVDQIPPDLLEEENTTNLKDWLLDIQVAKACHNLIVIEGKPNQPELESGAVAAIRSMEGNVTLSNFEGDGSNFYTSLAEVMELLCGAEMVNVKEGFPSDSLGFREWVQAGTVQELAKMSRILAKAGLLWDLDLEAKASRGQLRDILRTLRQAGLGEGMMSGIERTSGIMAISETGVSKTGLSPYRGEIVPVTDITQFGAAHLIMNGIPEGHPYTLFERRSAEDLQAVAGFLQSSFLRGQLPNLVLDMLTRGKNISVDHPPSIEVHENGMLYRYVALLHDSIINRGEFLPLQDYLEITAQDLEHQGSLSVIPEGVTVAADAGAHLHKILAPSQQNPYIKTTNLDMSRLNFQHAPPCGSREGAIELLTGVEQSYREYGLPESPEEVRSTDLPGHGSFSWGFQGPVKLAETLASANWEPFVRRVH